MVVSCNYTYSSWFGATDTDSGVRAQRAYTRSRHGQERPGGLGDCHGNSTLMHIRRHFSYTFPLRSRTAWRLFRSRSSDGIAEQQQSAKHVVTGVLTTMDLSMTYLEVLKVGTGKILKVESVVTQIISHVPATSQESGVSRDPGRITCWADGLHSSYPWKRPAIAACPIPPGKRARTMIRTGTASATSSTGGNTSRNES
eukprot:scaffold1827_cov421-Prasinococcus_capsulatus_cf.AAC.45